MRPLLPQHPTLFMRVRRLFTLSLSGGIAAVLLWAAGDRIAHGDTFRVTSVVITGARQANQTHLRHLADIRLGAHMFQADLTRAVHGVERHPWVEAATARRRFPGTVEIEILEHRPKILVALDALWYADAKGHVFKQADSERLDFPVLTGIDPDMINDHPELGRRIVLDAVNLLRAISTHPTVAPGEVSELHFDTHRGFSLVLRNGSRVIMGFDAPGERLSRLAQMTELGLDLTSPQVVDLDLDTVAIATPLPR